MPRSEETPTHVPNHIAEAARDTLRAHPTVRRAVLFGSRARGDHRPDSDWDIALIVGETATPYNEIEASLARLSGVSPMCVREAAMGEYAHRTDTVHAAIASEGVVIAGSGAIPQPKRKPIKIGWPAVQGELTEARRSIRALAIDNVEQRIARFTDQAVTAFATAQALTRKLVPRGRKDAEALLAQLRDESTGKRHPNTLIITAAEAALHAQWRTREEAVWALIALNRAWCDAQPMHRSQTRHCVARHLDAARREFAREACNRRDAPAQALRSSAREAIHSLDSIARAGRSMPAVPWATTHGQWVHRITRMELDARTLVRARSRSGALVSAPGCGGARESVDVHRAAARLARLAWHNNVSGLTRAHPDQWLRNPYLWQLVEAGALTGADRQEAATELRAYPRIAPWAAWPHACVRHIEKMNDGSLDKLPGTHGELLEMAAAQCMPYTGAADFSEGPELTIEVDTAHVTLSAENGTRHVIGRAPSND